MPFDFGPFNRNMGQPVSKGPGMRLSDLNNPGGASIMPVPALSGPGQGLPSNPMQLPPQAGMSRNFPQPQMPNMNQGWFQNILSKYRNNPMPQMPQMSTPYQPSFDDLMNKFDKRMGMFG
jgi:hypothetical protein